MNDKAVSAKETESEHEDIKYLFLKTYKCPVCDHVFKVPTVKTGRVKLDHHDIDLRPRYLHFDVLKYDAVVCPRCGFADLSRFWHPTSSSQNKWILSQITPAFGGIDESAVYYSYDESIKRHKMALMCNIVKHGRESERAYIELMIAWLYRGRGEETKEPEVREESIQAEQEHLSKAFEGFKKAYSSESFPMCGMDEMTVVFLVAAIAAKLGNYQESKIWISRVITSRTASEHMKDRGRDLRDWVKEREASDSPDDKNK